MVALPDDNRDTEQRQHRLTGLVGAWQAEADRRVTQAQARHEEWILDLHQYHSRYDPATEHRLKENGGSRLFVPKTRPETNAMSARIMDILFPTDDRNWAIEPTPVPSTAQGGQGDDAEAAAKASCELMQEEIDDQLTECRYQAVSRDVIEDACKLGTGIFEGPIASDNVRRGWKRGEDGTYQLQFGGDPRPAFYRVDPWGFFPSDDARTMEENEDTYVRYLWNKKDLRRFAKVAGVDPDAVRDLLRHKPAGILPDYLNRIRTLTGETTKANSEIYQVWKFSGSLTADNMRDLAMESGDMATAMDMTDIDPLDEIKAVVWFCQGLVLKFSIYPLDSGETNYSVFCLEKDEASVWGYGVPRMLRDPQKGLGGAWRMLMDNGGLSCADQIIVNKRHVQQEGYPGDYNLRPRGVWTLTPEAERDNVDVRTAFATFHMDSHIQELSGMMELAYRQIEDASCQPKLGTTAEGTSPTNTPVGTMILMQNAANIVFARTIKNWDDDVTAPNLRRAYDWNMQFSQRDEIKGDFDVKPRGASVLLVREMQTQNLLMVTTMFSQNPAFAKYQKNLAAMREIYRGLKLDNKEFVASDEEAQQADQAEAQAAQGQQQTTGPDHEIEKMKIEIMSKDIDAKTAIAEMDRDARLEIAQLQHETAMMKLAETTNMSTDKIQAMLVKSRADNAQKERSTAAEIAVRAQPRSPLNQTQIANS